jgi:hypothetical protein
MQNTQSLVLTFKTVSDPLRRGLAPSPCNTSTRMAPPMQPAARGLAHASLGLMQLPQRR